MTMVSLTMLIAIWLLDNTKIDYEKSFQITTIKKTTKTNTFFGLAPAGELTRNMYWSEFWLYVDLRNICHHYLSPYTDE